MLRAGEFLRQRRVTDFAGVEIRHGHAHPVLDFAFAEILQVRPPLAMLLEVFGYMFGKKDVPGIAAVHHPLGDVNSTAGQVRPVVYIGDFVHRTAVNAHAQTEV